MNASQVVIRPFWRMTVDRSGSYRLRIDAWAKMSVAPAFRGRGISKLLIEQCLQKAREIKVGKLILYSNSQLQTAIRLYTKYGFQHVPVIGTPFVTADVKMEWHGESPSSLNEE